MTLKAEFFSKMYLQQIVSSYDNSFRNIILNELLRLCCCY